jgi:hypothetical protein
MDGTARPYRDVYNSVDDIRKWQDPPLDLWADYLHVRYAKREALYNRLKPSDQEQIRKEVRRVRYFRNHFKDYRISAGDRLPLVALLEDSRTRWRALAHKRCPDELAKLQREIEKHGEDPTRLRNRSILRMVQLWRDKEYPLWQDEMAPDSYVLHLEHDIDQGEDNPKEPNYGYNGWLIAWEQDKGGVTVNHPLIHGKFPHQKISMQQLLYNKAGTPLKRDAESKQLRYFHLPANSMKWVEVRRPVHATIATQNPPHFTSSFKLLFRSTKFLVGRDFKILWRGKCRIRRKASVEREVQRAETLEI